MNNYCTNCGKKLEPQEANSKCINCNTPVVDTIEVSFSKIFTITCVVIVTIVIGIIFYIYGYQFYYKSLSIRIKSTYLEEYPDTKFTSYNVCRECTGSCDGSCLQWKKVKGCYEYYYKSDPSLEEDDICAISNQGIIYVDKYSAIIHKYGFDEKYGSCTYKSHSYPYRDRLGIYLTENNEQDTSSIYNMLQDLISENNQHTNDYDNDDLVINLYNSKEKVVLEVKEISKTTNSYTWTFGSIVRHKVTLSDFERLYSANGYSELDE